MPGQRRTTEDTKDDGGYYCRQQGQTYRNVLSFRILFGVVSPILTVGRPLMLSCERQASGPELSMVESWRLPPSSPILVIVLCSFFLFSSGAVWVAVAMMPWTAAEVLNRCSNWRYWLIATGAGLAWIVVQVDGRCLGSSRRRLVLSWRE